MSQTPSSPAPPSPFPSEWGGALRVERSALRAAGPELIVCASCEDAARGDAGSGERLLALLKDRLGAWPELEPELALGSIRCLWACRRGCTVHLRAPGRMGYVLGDFAADEASARLLLAFAALYRASPDGVVLVPQWPSGLHGHFLCRVPGTGAADAPVPA